MANVISTDKAPAAIGPFFFNDTATAEIYTSGMIPIDPSTGELVTGSVEAQAEQAISNLEALLAASGSSIEKAVKTVVFISNMDDFGKINEVYAKHFKEPYPARSCVQVARLPKDVAIEIEAVAVKN